MLGHYGVRDRARAQFPSSLASPYARVTYGPACALAAISVKYS